MGESRRILVVGDRRPVDALARALSTDGSGIDVVTADADEVAVALCRSAVDCLVVPAVDAPALAANVAYAARGLYPDLPVVLYGPDPPDADATAVRADHLDDEAVVAAVRAALSEETEAARPRSRPETILASMFEALPVHLYVKDCEARHLLASDELIAPSDLLGLTDVETLSGEARYDEANYSDDRRVIETGEPVVRMDEYADSLDRFLRTSKVPWRGDDGEILGLVGVTQDVTELRERTEELRRRNRRLRTVALMTAHELRNELQVTAGHLSRAAGGDDHVAAADESVDRLSRIVDRIVSLATGDRHEDDPETMWLSAVVREAWETLAPETARLELGEDCQFRGDRESTWLLVETLLDNAIEYGGPDVTVEVGATEAGFFVADDGPGIEVDPTEQVFEAGVASAGDAAGFGLYIARRVAEDHGWDLRVTDREAGGARFDVVGLEEP